MPYPKGTMLQRAIVIGNATIAKHLGIYIGNEEVVHFGYPAADLIVKTSLSAFSDGKKIFVKQYPDSEHHGDHICKVASYLLHTPANTYNEKYNIFFNNCEDFCRECYGNASYLKMDQWEAIRGKVGETTAKTTAHSVNTVGIAARQTATSAVAKNAIGKSAGVAARTAIKGTVKSAYNTQLGKTAIEAIAKTSLGKSVYGGAAINNVSKLARGNAFVGAVTTIALTGPDFYRAMIDKSVSWQQLSKNFVTNGSMVAGGVGGWAGGAALGTAILPGVGTIVGGLAGSIIAGTLAEKASKVALDYLREDDSKLMLDLVREELVKLCLEFQISEDIFSNGLMPRIAKMLTPVWLREMYKSGSSDSARSNFAYSQCKGVFHEWANQHNDKS
jgi:hypothetical protein